jgi:hypothetical protein
LKIFEINFIKCEIFSLVFLKIKNKVGCFQDKPIGSSDQSADNQTDTERKKISPIEKVNSIKNKSELNTQKLIVFNNSDNIDKNTRSSLNINNFVKKSIENLISAQEMSNSLNVPTIKSDSSNLNVSNINTNVSNEQSRKKYTLSKGYSLMDWIRYSKSTPNLSGTGGNLKAITYEELSKHNKEDDCWMAIYGKYSK